MRHRVANRKLGRVTEHRLSLLRNQATALLRHERIETTVPKARELRPFVERLITIAKRGLKNSSTEGATLHAKRLVGVDVQDTEVVGKLFETIAPRFEARPGGYTRVLKLGARRGDNAAVAQIELIGSEFNPNLEKSTEDGAAKAPEKGAGGVRSRLRAAANRLRGGKGDKGDNTPEGGPGNKNSPVPSRRVTTPRKAG